MNTVCSQLLQQVYETGFAMDDVVLYLDSHPCDQNALNYYHYVMQLQNQAVAAYETQCGPLMPGSVNSHEYWTWLNGRWPWEGGNC